MTARGVSFTIGLLLSAALLPGCGDADFPASPSPVAQGPVVTLQGGRYSGNVVLASGTVTPINVTLIARALGVTVPGSSAAQAPGTTEISGTFETGSGLRGTVTGSLDGTLENGTFRGSLSIDSGCSRQYSGPVSTSGVSWLPLGDLAPNCPLTFVVHTARSGGPACTVSISALSALSGNGGTITVTVTTGPLCTWAAEPLAPWLRVVGQATGTGSGTFTLAADPNAEGARQGALRIAGQTVTVSQGPACTFSVAPLSLTFSGAGGTATVTVTAQAACAWTVEEVPAWIAASPASGTGNATVTLVAQPNAGPQRQATVRIAGQTIAVVQQAATPCSLTVVPATVSFAAAGGAGTATITATAECAWTAQVDVPWIQISGPSAGAGSGSLSFTVLANSGARRSATIRVDGQTVVIDQAGVTDECAFVLSTTSVTIDPAGGDGSVTVTTGPACTWIAQSASAFIRVSGQTSFTGSGTATFFAQANISGAPRQGTVQIAGQTVTVNQQLLLAPVTVTLVGAFSSSQAELGGGSIVSNPAAISCTLAENFDANQPTQQVSCTVQIPVGTPLTLTATPAARSEFVGWGPPCTSAGTGPCTVTVVAGPQTFLGTFRALRREVDLR